jgi:hypothetical protein
MPNPEVERKSAAADAGAAAAGRVRRGRSLAIGPLLRPATSWSELLGVRR